MNFLNDTFDLKTQSFEAHSPTAKITRLIPYNYDPTEKCPKFLEFQNQIYDGSEELKKFSQKIFGYSLFGGNPEQVLFIKYGFGSSGKSTETDLHSHLLAEYAQSTNISSFLEKRNDGIRNDLARMAGSRFVVAAEVGVNKFLDESLIKSITGGERIIARFLYGEFFEYLPQFVVA